MKRKYVMIFEGGIIYQFRGEHMKLDQLNRKNIKSSGNQSYLTLHEIAYSMGLTKERIRQIEAKALTKLRKQILSRGLKVDDLLFD